MNMGFDMVQFKIDFAYAMLRMQVRTRMGSERVLKKDNLKFDKGFSYFKNSKFPLRYVKCSKTIEITDSSICRSSCYGSLAYQLCEDTAQKVSRCILNHWYRHLVI